MKLLLDHNLSFRLLKKLPDLYPDSVTAQEAGLSRASDQDIWALAKRGGYIILTARDGQVRLDNFGGGTLP